MATTINQSFLDLKANVNITRLQESTVSTRQTNIREVVKNGAKGYKENVVTFQI